MSFFYQNRQEQLYLYLSKNNPYAVHLHRQLELIYVLSGSTTVTVEQQDFYLPRSGCSGFSEPDAWPEACGTRSESALYLRAGFLPLFPPFFQNKKPARNDFTVSSLSEHSRIALQGLKTLAAAMEKDRPTPSDVQVYAEGYLTLLLADLLPSLPLQVRKTQMTWNWSKDCFSIWMPTIPKNCPWKVSRKNSVSAALSCPGSSLRNSTPLFLIT